MKRTRQYAAIDIAKYIGAMLVVAIHTFPFIDISESFNLFFISTICRLAVPFFFVCSAFFLFSKMQARPKRSQSILMLYLRRLLILYLVWTVIYLPYTIWNYTQAGFSFLSLLGWIRDFFLNGSYYHLWFLPALMLGTLIFRWLSSRESLPKALLISLGLYLIGWLINVFAPLWQSLAGFSMVYGFFEKTLVTARDGIFFAPAFVAIGALCARTKRQNLKTSAIGFGVSFLCLILEVTLYAKLNMLTDLSCMFLSLIPCEYFLLQMLLQTQISWKESYTALREDSTLIYVSHVLFARILLMWLPNAHLVVYLLTLFCAQMLSYAIVKESKRLPWLKYLY